MFYHDHALGMTRLNVFAGLAGFYVIQDPNDRIAPLLPGGKYWLPLAIQDRVVRREGHVWQQRAQLRQRGRRPRRAPLLDTGVLRGRHDGQRSHLALMSTWTGASTA